jgi:cell wall-associated NlpC family hydrolase
MDPAGASRSFYAALLRTAGWQVMSVTSAAHTVQGNADPNFYTQFQSTGDALFASLSGTRAVPVSASVATVQPAALCRPVGLTGATATPASLPLGGSTQGRQVMAAARADLGKPYIWAAAGPDAYDCSGLTMTAWAAAGSALPHNAQAQSDSVKHYPMSQAQPGDLVFFGAGHIHHVGLYVSPGVMLDAPHSGAVVRIEPFFNDVLSYVGRPA